MSQYQELKSRELPTRTLSTRTLQLSCIRQAFLVCPCHAIEYRELFPKVSEAHLLEHPKMLHLESILKGKIGHVVMCMPVCL